MYGLSSLNSVNNKISFNECTALNVEGGDSVREVFGFGGTVKSNKGDPDVLVFVKFKEGVNISGIRIEGPMDEGKYLLNLKKDQKQCIYMSINHH